MLIIKDKLALTAGFVGWAVCPLFLSNEYCIDIINGSSLFHVGKSKFNLPAMR